MADADDYDDHGNATEKTIRDRSRKERYPDQWFCPECTIGEMESADEDGCEACDWLDPVRCDNCGHECKLHQIMFIRGDIEALIAALDKARAALRAEYERGKAERDAEWVKAIRRGVDIYDCESRTVDLVVHEDARSYHRHATMVLVALAHTMGIDLDAPPEPSDRGRGGRP